MNNDDEIEALKKQVAFLRINAQVCYSLIPPILMSIKLISDETGNPELLKEVRDLFQSLLDRMLFEEATRDESYAIAQTLAALVLTED